MVKKSALISLIFIIVGVVFTIIAYSSYWYKYETGDPDSTFFFTKVQYKYDKVRTSGIIAGQEFERTSKWNDAGDGSEDAEKYKVVKTYQASLAFIALAFIVLVVAAVLVLLQSLGLLKKIPCIGGLLNIAGKFILIAGTVFCLLSMFIFLNLPKAMEEDCKNGNSLFGINCDNYKFTHDEENLKYGPDLGWIATVIASGATIVACVINIIGGIF